ncbi:hypothetical protein ALP84_04952 [Pseudomonas cichorii]|uniref:EamA domain-containing protein n=2 Tax=Pseudomonas cichorii TaxID=36746 RepID=A0A3M4VSC0_PSECI|nr:hypothetical protein ALP84_04952 [Pseudomonas cichorii]
MASGWLQGSLYLQHHIAYKTQGNLTFIAIHMWLVAGEHEEFAGTDPMLPVRLGKANGQMPFDDIDLFAPAFGICLGCIDIPGLESELPQLDLAPGEGLGQQHGLAARPGAFPGQFIDTAVIRQLGGLDQVTESHFQRLGHPVQGREADILLPRFDSHQHAAADAGLFRQSALTQPRAIAQAANVVADMLQHRGTLGVFFVHDIAHLDPLRIILHTFCDALCVACPIACKALKAWKIVMTSIRRVPRVSKAEAVLILITVLWGGTFLLVQHALTVSGPMFFVGLRFAAAACIVALFSMKIMRDLTLLELKAGLFIGISIMLGYGLQTIGLQTIPSSQSAFITALYVPCVPLLQWLVLGRRPGLMPSLGIALAFSGLMLLSGPEGASLQFSPGEVATIISAVAIAAEIIMIGAYAGKVDVRRVTVVQLATASILAFLMIVPTGESLPGFSWLLVISAVGLGAMSAVIQVAMNWAQKSVSPTRATVIYAGEPVWAGIAGRLAGERLPGIALLGAALIVAGVIVSEMKTRSKAQELEVDALRKID